MTIKDYSTSRCISYEAVRQSLKRYDNELKGHISKSGRSKVLDTFAIEFLDNHRQQQVLKVLDDKEDLENQQRLIESLQHKIIELQQQVIELQADQQKALEDKVRLELASKSVDDLQKELNTYKPFVFGLYRKKK